MNVNTEITMSNLLMAANSLCLLLGYIWIKPLRKAQARNAELERQLSTIDVGRLRDDVTDHEQRLVTIEEKCPVKHDNITQQLANAVRELEHGDGQARAKIYARLDELQSQIARLDERTQNMAGWLETVDGRLAEVASAVANIAGKIGVG